MSVGVIYQRADGAVLDMNPAAERILGVEQGQLSDLASLRAAMKTIHEDGSDFPVEEHPGVLALKTGRPVRNQVMGVYFPGEKNYHWINIHAAPHFEPGKDTAYQAFVTFDDVTERKRAEETLRRQAQIMDQVHEGIVATDLQGCITSWNTGAERLLGYSAEEAVGQPITFVYPQDQFTMFTAEIQPQVRKKGWHETDTRFRCKSGRDVPVHLVLAALKDGNGVVTGMTGSAVDISERKAAEEALVETEKRLASIYDTVGDVIFLLAVEPDGQFRFISVNKSFGRVTGIPPDQVIGRRVSEIIPEPSLSMVLGYYRHAIEAKSVTRWEEISDYPTGRLIGEVCVAPVLDPAGRCTHLVGSVHDITERKQAEDARRESEEKFKYVFDNSSVGKSITLVSGEMHANKAFCELLGYSPEELQSKKWQEITHPDDIALTQKEIDALLSGEKKSARFNKKYLRKDGSIVWADVSTSLRRDAQGKPLYLMTTLVDITERKRMEEELRESETRYQLVFENSGTANTIFDTDCRVILQNSLSKKLTAPVDALGKTALEVFGPEQGIAVTERMRRVLHSGLPEVFETKFSMPSGERWMRSSYLPLSNERQVVVGIQVISQDITERKQAEEALKIVLADLERSNQDLEQFAYIASHDLQEPLRMISSYTQLLAQRYRGKLDNDADEFIGYAVDGVTQMQRLINDLLAYSRVGTRGKLPEPVPADAALDRALENLQFAIQENKAEITRDPLPTVLVDDVQLAQVFQNLIANAIKFHREEPPRIRIAAEDRGQEWLFSVRDNGIGIDPQYLERVFVIFQRLNPRGKYPGTGIGLAICRKIVLRHGGKIWVEIRIRPRFDILFLIAQNGRKISMAKKTGKIVDILLVEDNPGDVRLTQEALQEGKVRINMVSVTDGVEAMDFLRRRGRFPHAFRPDLILLDLNLPRKSGFEVLDEIKVDEDLKSVPVVVLTTSQAEEDIAKSYALHANAFISKPVDLIQFLSIVKSIEDFWLEIVKLPPMKNRKEDPPGNPAEQSSIGSLPMVQESISILLIEDNPGDERLVREALRDSPGIQVVSADRLESGMERLAAEKVDGILLDLTLPDSQGLDSVLKLRQREAEVPIVVLTGLDDEETAIKALHAGAQDYLVKNQLNPRLLAHTLRYAIERKRLDDRVYFQATHDDLTGLPNRALFRDRLQHTLARAERNRDEARGQPLAAVLLLDLDHFKTVNDTRGHAVGDKVLQAVAQRLQETLRKGDTIARLGGDEFAILVEGFSAGSDAAAVAQKILQSLEKPVAADGEEFPIGTSIGISLYPADGEDGEALFKHADLALYRAKERRNRYVFYGREE